MTTFRYNKKNRAQTKSGKKIDDDSFGNKAKLFTVK